MVPEGEGGGIGVGGWWRRGKIQSILFKKATTKTILILVEVYGGDTVLLGEVGWSGGVVE